MNDTKPGWKTNISDNKIKIHKNPDGNDGSVTNKMNPNRITVGACGKLGQSRQCLPAMEEHGQFGDLGKPGCFPDVNCKLIKPHTRSTATKLPWSGSVTPLTGGTRPFYHSVPFFHPSSVCKGSPAQLEAGRGLFLSSVSRTHSADSLCGPSKCLGSFLFTRGWGLDSSLFTCCG